MTCTIYYTSGPNAGAIMKAEQSLEDTAKLLQYHRTDVEWAIEEYGRCDSLHGNDELVAVETGDDYPGPVVP